MLPPLHKHRRESAYRLRQSLPAQSTDEWHERSWRETRYAASGHDRRSKPHAAHAPNVPDRPKLDERRQMWSASLQEEAATPSRASEETSLSGSFRPSA